MLNPGIEARSAEKNIAWAAGPGTSPDASSAESAADLGAWVFASGIGVSVQHGMVFGALTISGAGIALASTALTVILRLRRNLVRVEIGCERLGMALTIHRGYVTVRTHEINGIALQASLPHVLLPAENVQG
jgi:hypothetical protein